MLEVGQDAPPWGDPEAPHGERALVVRYSTTSLPCIQEWTAQR